MSRNNKNLAKLSHSELLSMRSKLPKNTSSSVREELASKEHRAFAREWSKEQPLLAALSMPVMTPGYTAGKQFLRESKSPTSLTSLAISIPSELAYRTIGKRIKPLRKIREYLGGTRPSYYQAGQAFVGLGEGLKSYLQENKNRLYKTAGFGF